jgi:hypothetical protein
VRPAEVGLEFGPGLGGLAVLRANHQADNAKKGVPVEPLRVFGLEILSFRADLAHVELADPKAAEAEAYEEVKGADKLLYLGRADGAVVLYEPARQSSWRLPASTFAVRTLNCETKLLDKDPECPD